MSSFVYCQLNILNCTYGLLTNNILVSAQLSAVTGQLADSSIFWLRQLQSFSCQLLLVTKFNLFFAVHIHLSRLLPSLSLNTTSS